MSDPSDFCIGCMNDEYPEGLRKEIESLRRSPPDAHELWAAAQLANGEVIEDGVARIEAMLSAAHKEK